MAAVRCALPNGYTIEVGTPGASDYAFYVLKPGTAKTPSAQRIPDSVILPWLRANAENRYVREKLIYVER